MMRRWRRQKSPSLISRLLPRCRLKDLACEPTLDIVLMVGDEDVLDEIGFVDENKVVERRSRDSPKSSRMLHGCTRTIGCCVALDGETGSGRPAWISGSGTTPGS